MAAAQPCDQGIMLRVRATPGAKRAMIGGLRKDAAGNDMLDVRVSAPPEDGRANDAIIALLADAFGVARRDVVLQLGAGARIKRFLIAGDSRALLLRANEITKGGP